MKLTAHIHVAFKVLNADGLRHLYGLLEDEQRPFELVVRQPIAGVRPVVIMATNKEDAAYFVSILNNIA